MGSRLKARCHFAGPKKVSISRNQPSPTCPRNGFASTKSITYSGHINHRSISTGELLFTKSDVKDHRGLNAGREGEEAGLEKYNLEARDKDSLADIYDQTTLNYLKGNSARYPIQICGFLLFCKASQSHSSSYL